MKPKAWTIYEDRTVEGPALESGLQDVVDRRAFEVQAKQIKIYEATLRKFAKYQTVTSPDGKRWPIGVIAQRSLDQAQDVLSPQLSMEV